MIQSLRDCRTVIGRDPNDNMVLGCAVEGKVQYIVSGDNDLLVLKQFRDIQIVRASDFLGVLTKGTD